MKGWWISASYYIFWFNQLYFDQKLEKFVILYQYQGMDQNGTRYKFESDMKTAQSISKMVYSKIFNQINVQNCELLFVPQALEPEKQSGWLFSRVSRFFNTEPQFRDTAVDQVLTKFFRDIKEDKRDNVVVLEGGVQAGQVFRYYANDRMTIHGVDPSPMWEFVWKSANAFADPNKVFIYRKKLEDCKEIKDNSVDYVVAVTLFCCVDDVDACLKNIHRVLKAGGKMYFSEHVLGSNVVTQTIQNMLDPLHLLLFGCHWNRDFRNQLEQNGLKLYQDDKQSAQQLGFTIPLAVGIAIKQA
eukprot:TRINITY_DN8267_c0_g1_i2.p1 TRINITY_DN8267_c0_g1~~TRINITY_DN8267_c0_g1_i2.p1  ORF type:complete len:300 (-),score=30.52 TRINITY_DN8267_c0_g1_i2:73-972(-)